jgi:hypothetical protein
MSNLKEELRRKILDKKNKEGA